MALQNFPLPSGMVGTIISVPPPRTQFKAGDHVGIFRSTVSIAVDGLSWPEGTYFIRSIESPYSTIGAPPALLPFRMLPQYRESNDRMQQQLTQYYDVPWNYRVFWQQAMLGDSYLDAADRVRRSLPPTHPDYPQMIPIRCECEGGIGVPAGDEVRLNFLKRNSGGVTFDQQSESVSRFGFARYAVTWGSVRFSRKTDSQIDDHIATDQSAPPTPAGPLFPSDLLDGQYVQGELWRYVTRQEDFSTESLTLTSLSGMQTVEASPKPIGELPAKVFPLREVTYSWHQVPDVPLINIEECLGKANSTIFDTVADGKSYARETLLFIGAKYLPGTTPTGRLTYDIEYKFLYRPNGWRKVLKPGDTFEFVYVSTSGTLAGTFIYDVIDLTKLFRMTA